MKLLFTSCYSVKYLSFSNIHNNVSSNERSTSTDKVGDLEILDLFSFAHFFSDMHEVNVLRKLL